MQKRAPTLGNIVVIILFVLSCFGLLMFLWASFGGPLPLKPKGYRFNVSFERTLALAEESDVRISGVNVGHVVSLETKGDGLTHATVELNGEYAPIRRNMHAILRQKTLLGETYVQLIPHGNNGPWLADGGQLPHSQVEPSVTLDGVLSAFDPKTRAAFQVWMQSVAPALEGRGESVNASFAQLEPFATSANRLVAILASQEGAVRDVIKNTGVVFGALASRDHQLEHLIVNGERTFKAAAAASEAFAETWRVLPAFEHNSIVALKEIEKFSTVATPFLKEFQPAQRALSSALHAGQTFIPELDRFVTALGPLTVAAKKGLPDVKTSLDLTVPVLENLRPVLHNLEPFLKFTGTYVPELQAFFANLTAASNFQGKNSSLGAEGATSGPKQHLLTSLSVLNPQALSLYSSAIGTSRQNPYQQPGASNSLPSGLPVFSSSNCANSSPAVEGPPTEAVSQELIENLTSSQHLNSKKESVEFGPIANKPETENAVKAPPCRQQGPFTWNGESSQFPHVVYSGK